jgi:uncharacterized protein YndB with AHSA1/START domain
MRPSCLIHGGRGKLGLEAASAAEPGPAIPGYATTWLHLAAIVAIMQPGGCGMLISELSRIDRTIDIQAAPERVWRALTNAAELSDWFHVAIEGEIVPGNEVWMTMTNAEYAGQRFGVQIVEMTPPRRLVWQWHPGEVDPAVDYSREPRTIVTFALEPTKAGTRLSLAETGFDAIALQRRAKVYGDNTQGWSEVVVWLQTHVEASR